MLRLHCYLTRPLTTELVAMVPQLEELDLGCYYRHPLPAPTLAALTRLRVLRIGSTERPREPFTAGELPTSLQRVLVMATAQEEADRLVPVEVRHAGLGVEVQSAEQLRSDLTIDAVFKACCATRVSAV